MKRFSAVLLAFVLSVSFDMSVSAYSASAYCVIEQSTGRVLYSSNENTRMTMASTTKVMTALLVIEGLDLDASYTVPDEAVGIEGSSIYLKRGDAFTGRELLYGLMLASGNDAAYALAVLTGGSVENFVSMMNDKAAELGLNDTHFSDPCGLASAGHYTTALDLARLCAVCMDNEVFRTVVSTKQMQIGEGENTRYLYNKNRILGELLGGNGIKTGYTTSSGRCLCSSATRNGMTLICVVLNDYNWFEDSKALLEKGFSEYSLKSAD